MILINYTEKEYDIVRLLIYSDFNLKSLKIITTFLKNDIKTFYINFLNYFLIKEKLK